MNINIHLIKIKKKKSNNVRSLKKKIYHIVGAIPELNISRYILLVGIRIEDVEKKIKYINNVRSLKFQYTINDVR